MYTSSYQAVEAATETGMTGAVLAVDLDGTLSRTDTLHEALLGLLAQRPMVLLKLPGWLGQGRAGQGSRPVSPIVIWPKPPACR